MIKSEVGESPTSDFIITAPPTEDCLAYASYSSTSRRHFAMKKTRRAERREADALRRGGIGSVSRRQIHKSNYLRCINKDK